MTNQPRTSSVTTDHPAEPLGGTQLTEPGWGSRLHISARVVQIVLGLVWILDGALQFQPFMFGRSFINDVILPTAQGQPAPISWAITNVAHFMLPDVGVWNFLFATLQLAIGAGLLFRRTLKPALVVTIVWSLSVWFFGEGFGMLLTGTASPLTGAPGAVLPLRRDRRAGVAARGRQLDDAGRAVGRCGLFGGRGPFGGKAAGAWAVLWVGYAVLWLLPANRAAGSFSSAISGMASGEPSWYSHFLTTFSGHFAGISPQTAWLLAIVSLVIGLGPLVSGRPTKYLVAGAVLGLTYWVTGMAFGGILTGSGTDPNCGPLIVLIAVALLPTVDPVRASDFRPVAAMARLNPLATAGVAAGVFAALLLSATYPIAATASSAAGSSSSTGGSMAGMRGMASQGSGSTPASSPASTPSRTSSSMKGVKGCRRRRWRAWPGSRSPPRTGTTRARRCRRRKWLS